MLACHVMWIVYDAEWKLLPCVSDEERLVEGNQKSFELVLLFSFRVFGTDFLYCEQL